MRNVFRKHAQPSTNGTGWGLSLPLRCLLLAAATMWCFVSLCEAAGTDKTTQSPPKQAALTAAGLDNNGARNAEQLAYSLGMLAYIYGYPLVVMEQTKATMLRTRAPINTFSYSEALASPEFKDIITPNSSTLYFFAWLDLRQGPVVLHVPANRDGRYYSVQLLDMYTNTFRNVSNRSTMNQSGAYTIVGPGQKGVLVPKPIVSPTPTVWLIGRVEVNGQDDLSRAVDFEKQFKLTSAADEGRRTQVNMKRAGMHGDNMPGVKSYGDTKNKDTIPPFMFYAFMTEGIKRNPPPPCDQVLLDQFKLIGIDPEKGFHPSSLSPAARAGLRRAAHDAQQIIEQGSQHIPRQNGWVVGYGIGTYGDRFLLRSVVAYSGLGANVPSEELYARTYVDGAGQSLSGANDYVLHFDRDQIPQVEGFWALTLYNQQMYLAANAINRYSIGDTTEGLKYNPDGSLDLYLSQTSPQGQQANWLPAPAGNFNLVLRMFAPKPSMLNGQYQVPPVQRLAPDPRQ